MSIKKEKDEKALTKMSGYQLIATIEAVERNGRVDERGFALLRSDKELAREVGKLINFKLCPPTKVDKDLLSIMEDSKFFGPADWQRYFNQDIGEYELPISINELRKILEEKCPFEKNKKIGDTHFLFCLPDKWNGAPLTILQWQNIIPKGGPDNYSESTCSFHVHINVNEPGYGQYLKGSCIEKDVAKNKWYLMPRLLPGRPFSENNYKDQLNILPANYAAAKLIECVPLHFLIFKKNNERINSSIDAFLPPCKIHGNTADLDTNKETIRAGNFGGFGLEITDGYSVRAMPMGYGSIFLYRKLL